MTKIVQLNPLCFPFFILVVASMYLVVSKVKFPMRIMSRDSTNRHVTKIHDFECNKWHASVHRLTINETKLFFMHVPKVGGTTINFALKEVAASNNLTWQRHVHNCLADVNCGHSITYDLISSCQSNKRPFSFIFLRDPANRLISNYRYLQDDPRPSVKKRVSNFTSFILNEENIIPAMFNSRSVPEIKYRVRHLDFIGLTDNFAESYASLYYLLGQPSSMLHIAPYNVQNQNQALVGTRDISRFPEPGKLPLTVKEFGFVKRATEKEHEIYTYAKELASAQYGCLMYQPNFPKIVRHMQAGFATAKSCKAWQPCMSGSTKEINQ
jgi:hypothetical protein